ncbi:hypothetical protein GGR51DRAFT_527518 [Nemania sp. FL0031]|nr:hypothetical protein GGR51DRAFT_527518 [Nemania sp. FL0031]
MSSVHHPAIRPAPEVALTANDNSRPPPEHDEPPPYPYATSESEQSEQPEQPEQPEDSDYNGSINQLPSPQAMPAVVRAILECPIDDDEAEKIAAACSKFVRPEDFYYIEAICEAKRIDTVCQPIPEFFNGGHAGMKRRGIIVRHNVKRRWEKLGVWNPKWGFAGRKWDDSDDFSKWTWRWQPDGGQNGESPDHYAHALVLRALRLRQNLFRGEYAPVMPRSHLEQDVTADAAEAFLISRPCFLFQIEVAEEEMRFARLSPLQKKGYPSSTPRDQVIKWWKERGDWRHEYYRDTFYEKELFNSKFYRGQEHGTVTSWKWRHESPSPEPESLTPIIENGDCENPVYLKEMVTEMMKLTPEEIDELKHVFWPHEKGPVRTWIYYDENQPLFPGQLHYSALPGEPEPWKYNLARWPKIKLSPYDPNLPPFAFLDELRAQQQNQTSEEEEEEEEVVDPELDTITPPPPKRRRLRHHQPEDEANETQLRRSVRVAGMKRFAEPLPQETAPNKRTRARAAAKATAPISASSVPPPSRQSRGVKTKPVPTHSQLPQEQRTETPAKRGRGRPRKGTGPSVSVRPSTKKAPSAPLAPPATVRVQRLAASGADTSGTPRPRGRPRKGSGPGAGPSTKKKAPTAPARARAARGAATGTDAPGIPKRRGRPRKSE